MRIFDFLAPVAAFNEVRDQVHRSRPVKRHERGDVLDGLDLELAAQVAHAAGFQLEHAQSLRVVQQLVGLGVLQRDLVEVNRDALGPKDEFDGVAQDGQRLEPEEVHLQEAEVAHRPHRVLGHDAAVVVLLERQQVDQRLGADDDAGRVDAGAAGLVLEDQGVVHQFLRDGFALVGGLEVGVFLQRVLQAPLHVRDHLCEAVALAEAQAHDPADVADYRLRAHRAKGDDLGDRFAAVFVADVFDDLLPAVVGEVDVDVGRADALGVEEALEQESVTDRVHVRDLQQVGDHRAGRRTARHARNAVLPAPAHEVADDEEVGDVSCFLDDPEFEFQAVEQRLERVLDVRMGGVSDQ